MPRQIGLNRISHQAFGAKGAIIGNRMKMHSKLFDPSTLYNLSGRAATVEELN
jgi:hypothetical protein